MVCLLLVASRPAVATGDGQAAFQSITTSLAPAACHDEIDPSSADDAHRLRCPGVGGYALIPTIDDVREETITLVDPQRQETQLDYGKKVPTHDCRIDQKIEWRATTSSAKPVPIALIVHLNSYKNYFEPKTLIKSYWIIAKITSNQACITDTILDDKQSPDQVRQLADSAQARPCLSAIHPE